MAKVLVLYNSSYGPIETIPHDAAASRHRGAPRMTLVRLAAFLIGAVVQSLHLRHDYTLEIR